MGRDATLPTTVLGLSECGTLRPCPPLAKLFKENAQTEGHVSENRVQPPQERNPRNSLPSQPRTLPTTRRPGALCPVPFPTEPLASPLTARVQVIAWEEQLGEISRILNYTCFLLFLLLRYFAVYRAISFTKTTCSILAILHVQLAAWGTFTWLCTTHHSRTFSPSLTEAHHRSTLQLYDSHCSGASGQQNLTIRVL